MKNLKKFRDFLNEKFEYGEILFGDFRGNEDNDSYGYEDPLTGEFRTKYKPWIDPEYGSYLDDEDFYEDFLKKWNSLGIPHEPNTKDEKQFIDLLKIWTDDGVHNKGITDKNIMYNILKELMPLKSKFPKVLDPLQFNKKFDSGKLGNNFFYRGHVIQEGKVCDELIEIGGWKEINIRGYKYLFTDKPFKLDLGGKGFYSFTPDINVTEEILDKNGFRDIDSIVNDISMWGRSSEIPVILCMDKKNPNFIMNPDFVSTISFFSEEYETFFLGTEIETSGILIPYWEIYKEEAKNIGLNLKRYFGYK